MWLGLLFQLVIFLSFFLSFLLHGLEEVIQTFPSKTIVIRYRLVSGSHSAAARLLIGTREKDHITPVLTCLYQLPHWDWIDFKIQSLYATSRVSDLLTPRISSSSLVIWGNLNSGWNTRSTKPFLSRPLDCADLPLNIWMCLLYVILNLAMEAVQHCGPFVLDKRFISNATWLFRQRVFKNGTNLRWWWSCPCCSYKAKESAAEWKWSSSHWFRGKMWN